MQFFLRRGETTVPWKGMGALLLSLPCPRPQHRGMHAHIPRSFTHTIAVIGEQGHRFVFELGRVHLPFRCQQSTLLSLSSHAYLGVHFY
jgi:hypothetical protein